MWSEDGKRQLRWDRHKNGKYVAVLITYSDTEYIGGRGYGKPWMRRSTKKVLLKGENGRGREFDSKQDVNLYIQMHGEKILNGEEERTED